MINIPDFGKIGGARKQILVSDNTCHTIFDAVFTLTVQIAKFDWWTWYDGGAIVDSGRFSWALPGSSLNLAQRDYLAMWYSSLYYPLFVFIAP